ncbi:PH domain-containing protein [Luteimonas sp. 22616]|uniref:PH domain-containing protein n=1 Tax=Luteimonas sp. 22616 TaxID=3453951 RepID=UPI003F8429F1
MSESQPATSNAQTEPPAPADWQKLPPRARALFVGTTALGFALSATVAGIVFCLTARPSWLWWLPPACALAAAVLGAWLGWRRYRHTRWLLDADGFGLRRGRLWQSDTRVPGSRVQHLDIRRGPLERHFRLTTLVIHTAGTRNSEVSVSGLDALDAERLRDHLARQTDDDDDTSD